MPRRRAMLAAGCTLMLCAMTAPTLHAQRFALRDGDRLRVSWRDLGASSAEGRFVASPPDSLAFVTSDGMRHTVALATVNHLEVALGLRNRGREFAIGGAAVGVVIGAVIGASSAKKVATPTGESYPTLGDPTTGGILGALGGVLAGAFIGTWIGRSKETTRWQEVTPSALDVSLGPERASLGFRFVR